MELAIHLGRLAEHAYEYFEAILNEYCHRDVLSYHYQ